MPVVPPVVVSYPNDHKTLAESELHFPKGYSLAGRGTIGEKDIHGELSYLFKYFQEPVIDFVSVASTATNGDRYIYTGVGSSAVFGGASTNDIVGYLTVDSYGRAYNEWDFLTPLEGTITYVKNLGTYYYFNGSNWLALGTGTGGGTIPNDATITFTGSNQDTYIDLYTPTIGNEVKNVLFKKVSTLDDQGANIKIVLHDGTPANDVDLTNEVSVAEINGTVLYDLGGNGAEVTSGFSVKLLITDADIDSGSLRVITSYLP
jgi:hypothetical protein